jgi:hypothetical protein
VSGRIGLTLLRFVLVLAALLAVPAFLVGFVTATGDGGFFSTPVWLLISVVLAWFLQKRLGLFQPAGSRMPEAPAREMEDDAE